MNYTRAGQILFLILIVLSAVLPMIPVLMWSVANGWQFPSLLPQDWTVRGWLYLAEPYSRALPALLNSLIIASVVTLLSFPIGIPAARALGLHSFRGKRIVEFLVISPLIVPELPLAIGIHILFIRYGLSGTLFGVILIHLILVVPYVVITLAGVFSNYQPEAEESARTLGASPLRVFLHVTLPAILPGMIVGGLFAFIRSWRTYVFTLVIGGGIIETLPLVVFSFMGSGDNHLSSVLAMLFIAPAVLMLLFTSSYLTGSRSKGAFAGI